MASKSTKIKLAESGKDRRASGVSLTAPRRSSFALFRNPDRTQLSESVRAATASKLLRRPSKPSTTVPPDSREKHSFHSSSGSEDETFVNDDNQQAVIENLEVLLASKRQPEKITKAGNSDRSKSTVMPKMMRVVVSGGKKTGKTCLLQQLCCFNDISGQPYVPTIDDTYQIQTQTIDSQDSRPKEMIIFHDTAGINDFGTIELKKSYFQIADAFLLVYSVQDHESFNKMDLIKKAIEKYFGKEKKDVPIIVIGTMTDLPGRTVDAEFASSWAIKERVKLYELSTKNRSSLVEVVHHLIGRHFYPIKESKFSLSRKLRPEKSSASQQVLADI